MMTTMPMTTSITVPNKITMTDNNYEDKNDSDRHANGEGDSVTDNCMLIVEYNYEFKS